MPAIIPDPLPAWIRARDERERRRQRHAIASALYSRVDALGAWLLTFARAALWMAEGAALASPLVPLVAWVYLSWPVTS